MWKVTLDGDKLVFTPFFGDPAGQDPNDEITADQLVHTLKSRDAEIQDLKLENDRLQQREKLYQEFLNFLDCKDRPCTRCNQYCPDGVVVCKMTLPSNRYELINELKKRLEDLG